MSRELKLAKPKKIVPKILCRDISKRYPRQKKFASPNRIKFCLHNHFIYCCRRRCHHTTTFLYNYHYHRRQYSENSIKYIAMLLQRSQLILDQFYQYAGILSLCFIHHTHTCARTQIAHLRNNIQTHTTQTHFCLSCQPSDFHFSFN